MKVYQHKYYKLILKLLDLYNQREAKIGKFSHGTTFTHNFKIFVSMASDQLAASSDDFKKIELLNLFDKIYSKGA